MKHQILSSLLFSAGLIATASSALALTAETEEAAQPQNSGVYLALRQAFMDSDDQRVKEYLEIQLEREPKNPVLLEEAILSAFYELDLKSAIEYADRLESIKPDSIAIEVVRLTNLLKENEFEAAEEFLSDAETLNFFNPEIIQAWNMALKDDSKGAVKLLNNVASDQGELSFIFDYQRAMIEANINENYEEAAQILSNSDRPIYLSDLDFYSHLSLLRLAKSQDFNKLIEEGYGDTKVWPGFINDLVKEADRGKIDSSLDFASPQNAIGAYINALMLSGQDLNLDYGVERLLRGMAPNLAPQNAWFLREYMTYFFNNKEYDDVIRFAKSTNNSSFLKVPNEQMRVNAEFGLENFDAVRDWAEKPSRDFADELTFKADVYRRLEDYQKAAEYYEQALAKTGVESERMAYAIYGLAMSYERLGQWEKAEPLFLRAIELKPDSGDMLNYLGYSYVDRGENLDEGLEMIEKAVKISPDAGYIIDSLGWAYYRLGRFEDALDPLEEATILMPADPTVNAHLGDLYWKLGRKREARYQWKRAARFLEEDNQDLSMNELNERIENGL